jgi:hypothetical protein
MKNIIEAVKNQFPEAELDTRDSDGPYAFFNIQLANGNTVDIEYRKGHGYSLIGNREVIPFEGADEVYANEQDCLARTIELLKSGIPTGDALQDPS